MPEPIVTLNEESLKSDLRELVRKTVEDTLNGLLDEEAGDLVGAERYERAAGREALVRIAREGSLEMVRQLADLGLMEDKRFDAQIELLRQGNRMDCVAFLMERRHRSGAQADKGGEQDASASLRSKFAL